MARKRKLNKAVVAAVASVALLGGGAYLASGKIVQILRPTSKIVAAGDDAAARGDWEAAAINYGKAVSRAGNDVGLQLKLVDALEYTVKGDLEKLRNLRMTQAAILANDPRSVPSLRRVLTYQRRDVQQFPGDTAAARSLIGTADRLEQLEPGDRDARLARATASLEPYMRGLDVRADEVDAQRVAVDKLLEEKPADAEAFRMAVQFRQVGVQQALKQGDAADARKRVTDLLTYSEAAAAKAPDVAGFWSVRADVFRLAAILLATDEPQRAVYAKSYYDAMEKADTLVKSDDPLVLPIRLAFLQQLERRDPKQVEARYRKLVQELPDDRQARLFYAEYLARQPGRRDEAVALMESPWAPSRPLKAIESVDQYVYGLVERVRRSAIRLGALTAITDPAERAKRIDVIEQEYRALSSDADITNRFKPAVMRVQGGIELAKGKITEAINTLDAAMKLMNSDSGSLVEQEMLNDALMEYAQAQLLLNQTGQARPALTRLIERKPENLVARAILTDVLIREQNYEEADKQLVVLERFAGAAPEVQRMRLRMLATKGDQLRERYKGMAEDTRDNRITKLQVAATLNDAPEVARLGRLMLSADPADPEALGAFVQASINDNKRDDAVAAVAAALKAKPGDINLKAMADSLAVTTLDQRQQLVRERIENIADPFDKALSEGLLARAQGKPIDAIAKFKQAQKIKADDPRGYEAQFQTAVLSGRFDDADAVLKDLARLNTDQAGGALRRVQMAGARALAEPDAEKRTALFRDAVTQALQLTTRNRELAAASLLYAQLLQQTGDLTAAIDQYGQTLDKSPTNVDALIGITDSLMRAGRQTEARNRLDSARSLARDDPRVRELELNYELRFGDPLKAVDTLTAQVQQSPDDVEAVGRLGQALEQVAAGREGEQGQPFLARAADVYAKAFEKFPQDLRFLSLYADVQRRLGRPELAEQAVAKAAADPAHKGQPRVAMLLADQYTRSNKIDDAARTLGEMIQAANPPPVEAVTRLAVIYARSNRVPDALKTLDLRPDDAVVQRLRVGVLLDSNDVPAARLAVEKAIAAHPEPDTFLLAAIVALRGGDLEQCDGFANKVLAERPNDAAALFYRGQVRATRRPADLDGARDDLAKSRDIAPKNPEVRLTLADVYRRRGEREAALTELQQAWAANRDSKAVLVRLLETYARSTPPAWSAVDRTIEEAKASPKLAGDADVLLIAADTLALRNDTPGAVAAAKAALAINPTSVALQQRYFDVLLRARAFRDVITQTSTALTQTPQSWWLYRLRGLAFRGLDDKTESAKALDAAFNLAVAAADPGAVAAVARTVAQTADAKTAVAKLEPYNDPLLRVLGGELLYESGDTAATIAKLEPMTADEKNMAPAVFRRARQALGMAYMSSVPPQTGKAKAVFEELLKQTPDDLMLLNNLACVLLLPGAAPADVAAALSPAKRAYDLVNTTEGGQLTPIITDTYGWALVRNKQLQDGLDLLRRATETARSPEIFLHLGEAYLMADNLDGADAALADANRLIEEADRLKQRVDPALRERHTALSSQLANKKAATPGAN